MEWTVRIGEKDYVARTDDELLQWYREGRIKPKSLVFHPVLARWMRASELEELRNVARVPLSMASSVPSGGGMSAKTTVILVAVGIGIIALLVLISSIADKSAERKKVAEEAARTAERQRIRGENLATARKNLESFDPEKQPEEYARHCETIENLDKPSMAAELLAQCAAAHLEVARRSLASGDLSNARRVYGIARVTEGANGAEFMRFDEQLTRREAAARQKAEAEQKARAAKRPRSASRPQRSHARCTARLSAGASSIAIST